MIGICPPFIGIGIASADDAVLIVGWPANHVDDNRDSLLNESDADPAIFVDAVFAVIGREAELLGQGEDLRLLLKGEVVAGLVGLVFCWIPGNSHKRRCTHIAY